MDSQGKLVSNYIYSRLSQIYESNNDAAVRALLAKMRRGIGKNPGATPEIWEVTLEGLPDSLIGKSTDASKEEWAVHVALTLFALHQQGKSLKTDPMHKNGMSLGSALQMLVKSPEDLTRIKRRFDAVTTSDNLAELSHHLRGLIQIMKSENISLDYAHLGKDLFSYQFLNSRDSIRLQWGRDFYRINQKVHSNNQEITHTKGEV